MRLCWLVVRVVKIASSYFSKEHTVGIRNSFSVSFLEISCLSIIVLESCTPSAQKPASACPYVWPPWASPSPSHSLGLSSVLAASWQPLLPGHSPEQLLLPISIGPGRKPTRFVELSEHSWAKGMCIRFFWTHRACSGGAGQVQPGKKKIDSPQNGKSCISWQQDHQGQCFPNSLLCSPARTSF